MDVAQTPASHVLDSAGLQVNAANVVLARLRVRMAAD